MISKFIDKLVFSSLTRILSNKFYGVIYAVCLFLLILVILVSYLHSYYNWDVDHEIYFGQQLFRGDLIWTKEFHDKLPFIQIIYGFSSIFGGIQAWRTISWLIVIFTSIVFRFALPKLIKNLGFTFEFKKRISIIFALCYPIWIFNLPDDVSHSNAITVSLFTSATLILIVIVESGKNSNDFFIQLLKFFSISLYSAAISIRPYYLIPTLIYLFYFSLKGSYSNIFNSIGNTLNRFFKYLILMFILGCTLNIFPYLISGQFNFFVNGLKMNVFVDWNTTSGFNSFVASMTQRNSVVFWICFFATVTSSIMLVAQIKKIPELLFFHYLAVIGLFFNIVFVHWWPHYLTLFCGFFLLISFSNLNFLLNHIGGDYPLKKIKYSKYQFIVLTVAFVLMCINTLAKSGTILYREINHQEQPERFEELNAFNRYLEGGEFEYHSFLAPENMYIHWKLNEPRHGFPSAAVTYAIVRDLWVTKETLNSYGFMNSANQYCSKVEDSDIDFILLKDTSPIPEKCFESKRTKYILKDTLKIKNSVKSMLVYRNSETLHLKNLVQHNQTQEGGKD